MPSVSIRLQLIGQLAAVIVCLLATELGPAVAQSRPFPPERGRLRVEGARFVDADNHVWRWRGATEFLLFARYLNGEDITPQLDWLVDHGFNVLRVFGEVPDGFGAAGVGVTNYERPFDRPDFEAKLDAFFGTLEERGLRCEYTVLTYWDAMEVMRRHVQRVFDVAASHWNVMVEIGNEPEHNQLDVVAIMQGVDRHGVLSTYGLDPLRAGGDGRVPMLDYGVTHDLERNLERSPTVTKKAIGMQNTHKAPFVNDEPIGAIDPGFPGFKQNGPELFGGIHGGGARTVNRDLFISAAAIAYMSSAGYTYHFQRGLEGRRPTAGDTVQESVATALRDVARFLPNDLQLGTPVEPGAADFGLARKPDSNIDSAFGVVWGDQQWVIVPMPAPGWSAAPSPGWRIDAVGPVPYLLRLKRDQAGGDRR